MKDDYLQALRKYSDLDNKVWLVQYFELYKSTLNWPPGLPPINRCNLIKGTLREKFNSFYREKLAEFEHDFDNEKQTLTFF
jgi:hypothetical protein